MYRTVEEYFEDVSDPKAFRENLKKYKEYLGTPKECGQFVSDSFSRTARGMHDRREFCLSLCRVAILSGIDIIPYINTSGQESLCEDLSFKQLGYEAHISSEEVVTNGYFAGCRDLRRVYAETATKVEMDAFALCNSLEEVYLPKCVSFDTAAFGAIGTGGSKNLKKITVSKDIKDRFNEYSDFTWYMEELKKENEDLEVEYV